MPLSIVPPGPYTLPIGACVDIEVSGTLNSSELPADGDSANGRDILAWNTMTNVATCGPAGTLCKTILTDVKDAYAELHAPLLSDQQGFLVMTTEIPNALWTGAGETLNGWIEIYNPHDAADNYRIETTYNGTTYRARCYRDTANIATANINLNELVRIRFTGTGLVFERKTAGAWQTITGLGQPAGCYYYFRAGMGHRASHVNYPRLYRAAHTVSVLSGPCLTFTVPAGFTLTGSGAQRRLCNASAVAGGTLTVNYNNVASAEATVNVAALSLTSLACGTTAIAGSIVTLTHNAGVNGSVVVNGGVILNPSVQPTQWLLPTTPGTYTAELWVNGAATGLTCVVTVVPALTVSGVTVSGVGDDATIAGPKPGECLQLQASCANPYFIGAEMLRGIQDAYLGAWEVLPTMEQIDAWRETLETACENGVGAFIAEWRDQLNNLYAHANHTTLAQTDTEFIAGLYRAYLGRDAIEDSGGAAFWLMVLQTAPNTRDSVRAAFSDGVEFQELRAAACTQSTITANGLFCSHAMTPTAPDFGGEEVEICVLCDNQQLCFTVVVDPLFPTPDVGGPGFVRWMPLVPDFREFFHEGERGCRDYRRKPGPPIRRWQIEYQGLSLCEENLDYCGATNSQGPGGNASVLDAFYRKTEGKTRPFWLYDPTATNALWNRVHFERYERDFADRWETGQIRRVELIWFPCCDLEPTEYNCVTAESFIADAYLGAWLRPPTRAELDAAKRLLTTACTDGFTYVYNEARAFLDVLYTAHQHTDSGQSDETFIRGLYRAYLGRRDDVGGLMFWLGNLATSSREQVRQSFTVTSEFVNRRVPDICGPCREPEVCNAERQPPPVLRLAPSNLQATVVSDTEIALDWQRNALDNTGVTLEWRLGNMGAWNIIALPAATISHALTSLSAGTLYAFRVKNTWAVAPLDSLYSDVVTATTTGTLLLPNYILTEDGEVLTDESGNPLLIE